MQTFLTIFLSTSANDGFESILDPREDPSRVFFLILRGFAAKLSLVFYSSLSLSLSRRYYASGFEPMFFAAASVEGTIRLSLGVR
jgi:hypothetical protein